METLISLIIWILILAVLWGIIHYILARMPIDPKLKQLIEIIIGVIFLIIVLSWFVGWIPAPRRII